MSRTWTAAGANYEIPWGEQTWTLRVDDINPGLRSARLGPLLSLEGVAGTGRCSRDALNGASLVAHEVRFGRVEATYQPQGWGEMTVRAAWFPVEHDGIGLEIELSARSVEELQRVEIMILSSLSSPPEAGSLRSVEPRDRESAVLSYDGRETDLSHLVTGPPGDALGPWLASRTGREGWSYVEMVRPEDAARRIHEGRLPFMTTRYGLFGYDLERGVVLRGRLRGYWMPKGSAFSLAEETFQAFLVEPPPLRT
ncbi:MAG: hypothetical protein JWN86_474 [Planctomycetota bacterium]|nr:hypothetical protein [Planctomycetota bacterium]